MTLPVAVTRVSNLGVSHFAPIAYARSSKARHAMTWPFRFSRNGGSGKRDPNSTMKIRRTADTLNIELPFAEARVLFDELSDVRGGARLPKLKQVCRELETALELETSRRASGRGLKGKNIGPARVSEK